MPLFDLAQNAGMSYEELLEELNVIADGGTKLNINYFIEEEVDEEVIEEIFDYFHEADSASIEDAFNSLKDDDITIDEIHLARIKFMNEIAN